MRARANPFLRHPREPEHPSVTGGAKREHKASIGKQRMTKRSRGSIKRRVADLDADVCEAPAPARDADHRAHRGRRLRACTVAPWSHVVAGAEHPTWPQHFVETLRVLLLKLKEKFADKIRSHPEKNY